MGKPQLIAVDVGAINGQTMGKIGFIVFSVGLLMSWAKLVTMSTQFMATATKIVVDCNKARPKSKQNSSQYGRYWSKRIKVFGSSAF